MHMYMYMYMYMYMHMYAHERPMRHRGSFGRDGFFLPALAPAPHARTY